MSDIWKALSERRFKPAEAEKITGFSTELQRKWIERHFRSGNPVEALYHWRIASEGAHSRYTWAGVQALALFGEISSDVGIEVAKNALSRTSRGTVLHDFEFDWRDRENGRDLFLFHGFDKKGSPVTTTTLENIASRLASPHWSTRFYLYNFSELQRRLVNSAVQLLKDELA